MKNFQNFKILQIADNVTAANFVQVCFFFFLEAQQDEDCG